MGKGTGLSFLPKGYLGRSLIFMDLGVMFSAQNTCGYGSGSPMSALVLSLSS